MSFEEFCRKFEAMLAAATTPKTRLEIIAAGLSHLFRVKQEEIAIFSFDQDRDALVFVWPSSLKSVGSIPMSAHRSLVTKTAIERKCLLDNTFASTPHLYMFEHFLSEKEKRIPIQKIISCPVVDGDTLKGVIQVARKGQDREAAGADFTTGDMELLARVIPIICRFF